MSNDRAKHNILPLSKFCLMQITRQRVRPILDVQTSESCPSCFGTGVVKSSVLFTDSLEEKIDCLVNIHNVKQFTLHVHPYVAAYINKGIFSLGLQWKMKYSSRMKVIADQSLAFMEYKFYDPEKNELDMLEEKEMK
jgi:ribonuclease G